MPRVLLVEDHFPLRLALATHLRSEGYEVEAVGSAEEARGATARPPDLVLLDWNLPGEQGFELLVAWRRDGVRWPVVVITARDAVADRVAVLDAGADDFLLKPFANEELMARVRVQLRRSGSPVTGRVVLSGVEVDLARQEVHRDGTVVRLTTKEADLLRYLADRPGRAIARDDLLRDVWDYRGGVDTRAVDNAMLRLRSKVERDPANARHLLTVHGTGYRFEP